MVILPRSVAAAWQQPANQQPGSPGRPQQSEHGWVLATRRAWPRSLHSLAGSRAGWGSWCAGLQNGPLTRSSLAIAASGHRETVPGARPLSVAAILAICAKNIAGTAMARFPRPARWPAG